MSECCTTTGLVFKQGADVSLALQLGTVQAPYDWTNDDIVSQIRNTKTGALLADWTVTKISGPLGTGTLVLTDAQTAAIPVGIHTMDLVLIVGGPNGERRPSNSIRVQVQRRVTEA